MVMLSAHTVLITSPPASLPPTDPKPRGTSEEAVLFKGELCQFSAGFVSFQCRYMQMNNVYLSPHVACTQTSLLPLSAGWRSKHSFIQRSFACTSHIVKIQSRLKISKVPLYEHRVTATLTLLLTTMPASNSLYHHTHIGLLDFSGDMAAKKISACSCNCLLPVVL